MDESPVLHLSLPVRDLAEARRFYVDVLGCGLGRNRDDWFDVWFFGLQLTLQLRPAEARPPGEQGVRHFGVVLRDRGEFDTTVQRVDDAGYEWLERPVLHTDPGLSGKTGGKLADPSGNVIEIKFYDDISDLTGG